MKVRLLFAFNRIQIEKGWKVFVEKGQANYESLIFTYGLYEKSSKAER